MTLLAPETPVLAPPLVARLVSHHGAQWVDAANAEAFGAQAGHQLLFFSGDAVRFPECLDVAVVLPELQAAFPGRFGLGAVLPSDEDAVAARWGVRHWPSLLLLRDGGYVTTLVGMLDWTDYLERLDQALQMPVRRAPGIGIAVVSAEAQGSSCH